MVRRAIILETPRYYICIYFMISHSQKLKYYYAINDCYRCVLISTQDIKDLVKFYEE